MSFLTTFRALPFHRKDLLFGSLGFENQNPAAYGTTRAVSAETVGKLCDGLYALGYRYVEWDFPHYHFDRKEPFPDHAIKRIGPAHDEGMMTGHNPYDAEPEAA